MKSDEVTSLINKKKLEISKNLLSTIIKIPEKCIKDIDIGTSSIKIVNMNNLYKMFRLNKFLDKCEKFVISRGYEIMTNKNKKGIIVKIHLSGLIIKELFSTSKEQIIINYTEWILKYEEAEAQRIEKAEALAEKQRKKAEAQRIEKAEALAEKQRTELKKILTKEKFDNLLKDLELTRHEFSNITGIAYSTINNWHDEKKPIPSWVNSWFDYYIKAKDMDKVISAIKPQFINSF